MLERIELKNKMACLKNSKWFSLVEVYGDSGRREWRRDAGDTGQGQ